LFKIGLLRSFFGLDSFPLRIKLLISSQSLFDYLHFYHVYTISTLLKMAKIVEGF
jgi:hypothetical protein